MFKSKQIDELKVPTLEEASDRYAALKEREAALVARRGDIQSRIGKLCEEARKRQMSGTPEVDRDRLAAAAEKARRAGALVGDLMPMPAVATAGGAAPDSMPEIVALQDEVADLTEALRLLKNEINEETKVASRVICEAVKPEHDRRAAAVAQAFATLLDAAEQYQHLAGKLNRRKAQWARLSPLPLESSIGVVGSRFAQHVVPLVNAMTRRGDLDLSRLKGR